MRKAINVAALVVFVWLVIDAFQIHNLLLSILLAGVVPGTGLTLHPIAHLALLSAVTIIVLLEIFSDNFRVSKYVKNHLPIKTSRA